jgi:hypothetical protein
MGVIVFTNYYTQFQGVDQTKTHPIDASMTYTVENLTEVIIAAGKANQNIGSAVGTEPAVFDLATPFAQSVLNTGLLKTPLPRPHNQLYHDTSDERSEAIKNDPGGHYLEVIESVHVSVSCLSPHLTVYVKTNKHATVGNKIHICVKPDGVKWAFDSIHG